MRGTMVCGVSDSNEGRAAVELGVELSERLGLRLVLAHVVQGFYPHDVNEDRAESIEKQPRVGRHAGARRPTDLSRRVFTRSRPVGIVCGRRPRRRATAQQP